MAVKVHNQTSYLGYIRERPYLIKLALCLIWFTFTCCWHAYHNGNVMHRLHIEHSLVGSLLMLAAISIGFSWHFGADQSAADRWYMSSLGMVTGCCVGGFLMHVVLLQVVKMEPGSSTLMITYAFALLVGSGLTIVGRFKPAITSRLLLLFASIISAQSIGCHVDGTHSLLTAMLVGLFHQILAGVYDASYRGPVELFERAVVTGALIASNLTATFWIRPDDIWIKHGPLVVRVLALGHGERPDWKACIALLVSSLVSAAFLGVMMHTNKPKFAHKYYSQQPAIRYANGALPIAHQRYLK